MLLNVNSQTTSMLEAENRYITNSEQVSDKPIFGVFE